MIKVTCIYYMVINYRYFNIQKWDKDQSTQNETVISPMLYVKDNYEKLPESGGK